METATEIESRERKLGERMDKEKRTPSVQMEKKLRP
jgi:hypothetical protein